MTVIVFLLDNSCSMAQKTAVGTTCIDVAKSCVLNFMKVRQKTSRNDVYFILTLDQDKYMKLSNWQSSGDFSLVDDALDSITPVAFTELGVGIRRCFDLLNMQRVRKEYETYALGRYPNKIEPAIIICMSDGCSMSNEHGIITHELPLPSGEPPVPGEELYKSDEPYRWDYRLYGLLLRYPSIMEKGSEAPKFVPTDSSCPITNICEATGGRAYEIRSDKMLFQCLESLAQKCIPGVVVRLRKITENGEAFQKWHDTRRMILVRTMAKFGGELAIAHWPVPESFWLDPQSKAEDIRPRSSHPEIGFSTKPMPPIPKTIRLPYDSYELEPSPLTQYMLSRCEPQSAWYCYLMVNSQSQTHPFGYLRVNDDKTSVHMYVCAFNFPKLIALLEEFEKLFKKSVPADWHAKFLAYVKTLPSYYIHPLDRAMRAYGFSSIISDEMTKKAISNDIRQKFLRLKPLAEKEYLKLTKASGINRLNQKLMMPKRSVILLNDSTGENKHPLVLSSSGFGSKNIFEFPEDTDRTDLRHNIRSLRFYASEMQNLLQYGCRRYAHLPLPVQRLNINYQSTVEMGDYDNYRFTMKTPTTPQLRSLDLLPQRADTFGNPFRQKAKFVADEGFVDCPDGEVGLTPPGSPRYTDPGSPSSNGAVRRKGPLLSDIDITTWRNAKKPRLCPPSPSADSLSSPPSPQPIQNGDHSPAFAPVHPINTFHSSSQPDDDLFERLLTLCRNARTDLTDLLRLITGETLSREVRALLFKQAECEFRRLRKHWLLGNLLKSKGGVLEGR